MKKSYLPNGNGQRGTWLSNFNNMLTSALATKLGLSTAEKTALIADTGAFLYSLILTEASKAFEHQCVTYQLSMRNGPIGTDVIEVPVLVVVGVAPTPVAAGIFARVRELVRKIKLSASYTEDVGQILGIIGSEPEAKSAQDNATPILAGKIVAGNVQIKYTRGEYDGIKLESRRGTETNFILLEKINKPIYVDKRPNLVEGQPEKREYRAWFFKGDEVIGQVSAVITVTVAVATA